MTATPDTKTFDTRHLIPTDDYGPVPYELFKKLQRAHVTPADWTDITEAFYELELNLNFQKAWTFVQCHIQGGIYIAPWPFNPVQVVTQHCNG